MKNQQAHIDLIEGQMRDIRQMVEDLTYKHVSSRAKSLAITKLEEASLWLGVELQTLKTEKI